jgi:hypothetical protein
MPRGIYKRTKEQYEKICTPERAKKISDTLKIKYASGEKICWTKGKKLSKKHKLNIKKSCKRGEENTSWSGENPSYSAAHSWIKNHFGKAVKCENKESNVLDFSCSGKSNKFQWARKKGHRYSRSIDDYFQLCVSCHSKYDSSPTTKICPIEGCGKKVRRYGYCEKHGMRFKKWGNPLAVKVHDKPLKLIK